MKVEHIKNFHNGWFIGNFEPSLYKTKDFEIAVHVHDVGGEGQRHYHKIATEYNILVSGKINIDDKILISGDIFIYEPYDVTNVKFLEETTLIVIKVPSIPSDKFLV